MENEEVLEVFENDEISEVPEENMEQLENGGENSASADISNVDSVSNILSDADIANALRNFISEYSAGSADSSADPTENESNQSENESSANEISAPDYTQVLNDLYQAVSDSSDNASSYYSYVEVIENNNTLGANINEISLTNVLLIMLIGVFMFIGVLLFAREV